MMDNGISTDYFQSAVKESWPRINMAHLKDIADAVEYFTDKQREMILREFKRGYTATSSPPTFGAFDKILRELNLHSSRYDEREYAYRCDKCGALYAGRIDWVDVYVCPKCYSRGSSIIERPQKTEVVTYQSPCLRGWGGYIGQEEPKEISRCPIWETKESSYGPVCDNYGIKPGETDDCYSCSCRNCCEAVKRENDLFR